MTQSGGELGDVAFLAFRLLTIRSVAVGMTALSSWPAGPRTIVGGMVALPLTIQLCQSVIGTSGARFF
jgi:hypothetical protein